MSKELRAHLSGDKTHLILDEDGQAGDKIDLASFSDTNLRIFNEMVQKEIEKRIPVIQRDTIADFRSGAEFQSLLKDREKLQVTRSEAEAELARQEKDLQTKYQAELRTSQDELQALKALQSTEQERYEEKLKAELAQQRATLEAGFHTQFSHQQAENAVKLGEIMAQKEHLAATLEQFESNLEAKIKSAKQDAQNQVRAELLRERNEQLAAYTRAVDKYNAEITTMRQTIDELRQENERLGREHNRSIKLLGNDLEAWCRGEYERSFGGAIMSDAEFVAASLRDVVDKKVQQKPDFVFRVHRQELTEVAIFEMKSEEVGSVNKRTNESYLKKLEVDRKNFGAEYAVLVSELSSSQNDQYA